MTAVPPHTEFTVPRVVGRRVELRPIQPSDYMFLYNTCVSPSVGYRWRFRGSTPSPDEFTRTLWSDVLVQFIIDKPGRQPRPLGLVVAYTPDFRNGTVHLAMALDPDASSRGWPIEALILFVEYIFSMWSFRKVYCEMTDLSFPAVASGLGRYFKEEGRLEKHEYYQGRYLDVHITSLWRDDWEQLRPRLLRSALKERSEK